MELLEIFPHSGTSINHSNLFDRSVLDDLLSLETINY